jgi:hypothetical protein
VAELHHSPTRVPFRYLADPATLVEVNAALDSGERVASVFRRLCLADRFGINERNLRYYANHRHLYPSPSLSMPATVPVPECDPEALDRRIETFGRLVQKASAAFKDCDPATLQHDQRLLMTALTGEALAQRLRELTPASLLSFVKDLTGVGHTDGHGAHNSGSKANARSAEDDAPYGWTWDEETKMRRPRRPGEPSRWPPEFPEIVRRIYGVNLPGSSDEDQQRRLAAERAHAGQAQKPAAPKDPPGILGGKLTSAEW